MSWVPTPPAFHKFKKEVFARAGLVTDFIYQIGEDPRLRQPSHSVVITEISTKNMQAKIAYVKECMKKYRKLTGYGRGITAIQVGIPERFSVIYHGEALLVIINPKITKTSEKKYLYPEICMSANPIIAPIVRPAWIEFEYYDDGAKKQTWNTKDNTDVGRLMNRVFQHEFDHMEGIINIDKIRSPKELILESDPTFYDHAQFKEI